MTCKTVETDLDRGVLNSSEWVKNWGIGHAPFHQPRHIPLLDKYEETILEGGKKSIFVPLCGKSHDMIWFYERGCTVCGVEVAEIPVKEFFDEHKLEVEVTEVENVGKLYKSTDGRLRIYVADLFDMSTMEERLKQVDRFDKLLSQEKSITVCGQFDMIYDCRSISAINKADREQYANLLLSLLRKNGIYILCAREYDPTVHPGPPHSVSEKVVAELYGEKCDIEKLHEEDQTNKDIHAHARSEDTGEQTSETDGQTPEKSSDVGSILASSPYMYYRWFRMQKK